MMFACVIGIIGLTFYKESAGRNLLGSFPPVASEEEASELVRTQFENPKLDTTTMPIATVRPRS
ncbi:hypothetical protein HF984_03880 [Rothia terrae]|uniref:hypothetical protein n=1 Tax=Rothia terrae TaxID=396015 RepID=UPI0014486F84|nr:hypothetical protein [Rothia terrae]NKZ33916.1 hypothetical protein [Rothia terrae]